MEINTGKHNGASKFYESHDRVGRGHRWRCGCEGIKCPAARNQKARTRTTYQFGISRCHSYCSLVQ